MTTERLHRSKSTREKNDDDEEDDKSKIKDYLANERTFLAWARTGLATFALGCAIGKFGGKGNTTSPSLMNPKAEKKPLVAGLILVIIGVLCVIYGTWRFFRTYRQLKRKCLPYEPDIIGSIFSVMILTGALVAVIVIFFII